METFIASGFVAGAMCIIYIIVAGLVFIVTGSALAGLVVYAICFFVMWLLIWLILTNRIQI